MQKIPESIRVAFLQSEVGTRDFSELRNFLQRLLRKSPKSFWPYIAWVRKHSAKFSPNLPEDFSAKSQEKLTIEHL